ncbi:MAG: polynucleotide adenylyltransferase PcnB [Spirochaetales bacterium]|nr:polynucleotide adenylyltransferase PcnB [Spirochaetales bacterium]
MLVRYKNGKDGLDAVARVYSRAENNIDSTLVDRNAITVIRRLTDAGYESYLVGGAVRDMLLGRLPKDFDIATAASPRQVHKLFYNSRIIGRRFRIVHITFGKQIIEVSTFRSNKEHEGPTDNEFGTIEEDSSRRDFTINSLYYDPIKGNLIDFNNALKDFSDRKIVSLIPLNRTFVEDPVRMVRAVKYSVTTGFKIPFQLSMAIRHYAPLIAEVSTSRMTEEVNKILACGCSARIFERLNHYKLLVYMLPAISVYASFPQMFESLKTLDKQIQESRQNGAKPVEKARMYLALVQCFITRNADLVNGMEIFNDILRQIKVLLSPITPPNYELESAAALYMSAEGLKVPKGAIRHRNPDAPQPPRKRPGTKTKADTSENAPKKRRRTRKKPAAAASSQSTDQES